MKVEEELDGELKIIYLEIWNISVEMERWKPMEWNQLLNVVLSM